ncbi:MAG TPA: FAD-binding protein [Polyangiales bacterium]|nr:FAD-binding protein [Polyangiales bacterium]
MSSHIESDIESSASAGNSPRVSDNLLSLEADVLVIGGGPAGTWSAWSAASQGARVVLADKGYCGTSGATAPSGVGVWYVPPDEQLREEARASREAMGGHLSDRRWMDRVLDKTYEMVGELANWGYPFPVDDDGNQARRSLQGPEYMRLMRKRVKAAGVKILDHSPALELLADSHGVAGAAGIQRQTGERWQVKANAVIIATGGCAFLSKALGCNVLTGDGGLFAAEAGAELSGMEFSNAYGLAPAFASVTKSAFYRWATFYYEDGREIEGAGSARGRSVIARTLLTQPVYCQLDRAPESIRAQLRASQPNFFLPFDRTGIDPLTQRFPVTLRLEGTVRGTGGIRVVNEECGTSVPGLYAAGDASTRELICGGFTGGGSHNAAWAISTGNWAGAGAARYAKGQAGASTRDVKPLGSAALRGSSAESFDAEGLVRAVQAEVFPYDRNLFRTERGLSESLSRLDGYWKDVHVAPDQNARTVLRAREAAAMLATARFMYATARHRTETRGMHKRADFPGLDPQQQRRLITSGLEQIWVRPENSSHAVLGTGPVSSPRTSSAAAQPGAAP